MDLLRRSPSLRLLSRRLSAPLPSVCVYFLFISISHLPCLASPRLHVLRTNYSLRPPTLTSTTHSHPPHPTLLSSVFARLHPSLQSMLPIITYLHSQNTPWPPNGPLFVSLGPSRWSPISPVSVTLESRWEFHAALLCFLDHFLENFRKDWPRAWSLKSTVLCSASYAASTFIQFKLLIQYLAAILAPKSSTLPISKPIQHSS